MKKLLLIGGVLVTLLFGCLPSAAFEPPTSVPATLPFPTSTLVRVYAPLVLSTGGAEPLMVDQPTSAPTVEPPTVEPLPATPVPPTPTPLPFTWMAEVNGMTFGSDCPCDQGDVLNCESFVQPWEAQSCFLRCVELTGTDVHDLDRDHDGNACEWSW